MNRKTMTKLVCITVAVACILTVSSQCEARVWSSVNGQFQIEADAISFNEELVVLKKPTGELVAVELKELSKEDQDFVKSKENTEKHEKNAGEMQTWTGKDGMQVRGRVVKFGRREVQIQRKLGKVQIDGIRFSALDPLYQKVVLKALSYLENQKIEDEKQLEKWAVSLGGNPKAYTLEGVLMQLESGDEISVPFFLFSTEDLAVLEPGWELWKEREDSDKSREQESFLLRSAAMAYQQDRAANREVEMLKLGLLGAATGVVSIWQVGLAPAPGNYGRPTAVMVPAQNSDAAVQMALSRNPGYVLVAVRRASR